MLPQEIIRRKRDGQKLTAEEIAGFIAGLTSGAVSEGQAAAFAMAINSPIVAARRGDYQATARLQPASDHRATAHAGE